MSLKWYDREGGQAVTEITACEKKKKWSNENEESQTRVTDSVSEEKRERVREERQKTERMVSDGMDVWGEADGKEGNGIEDKEK